MQECFSLSDESERYSKVRAIEFLMKLNPLLKEYGATLVIDGEWECSSVDVDGFNWEIIKDKDGEYSLLEDFDDTETDWTAEEK